MKTSELIGTALDWAVAKCEGRPYSVTLDDIKGAPPLVAPIFNPSTSWQEGGPLIEREGIDIYQSGVWVAEMDCKHTTEGPTPLIAAMRCYVASKLGDDVDIPAELED
jgi:hypothetical protein